MLDPILIFWACFLSSWCLINLITVLAGIRYRDPAPDPNFTPEVSVISCMWNESRVAQRKIQNLLEQDYPSYEVIIVDNGSEDGTTQIVRSYAALGSIKALILPNHHELKSPGLDAAIQMLAKSQIILHSDADALMPRNWIRLMVQPFKQPQVGAVQGLIRCGNWYRGLFQALRGIEDNFIYCCSYSGRQAIWSCAGTLTGANYGLRRQALEQVGYHGQATLVEDGEVSVKLLAAGWKILALKSSLCSQEQVEDLSQYFKQRLRWYAGSLQVSSKYGSQLLRAYKLNPGCMIWMLFNWMPQIPAAIATLSLALAGLGLATMEYLWLGIYGLGFCWTIHGLGIAHFERSKKLIWYVPLFLMLDWIWWLSVTLTALWMLILRRKIRWAKIWHKGMELS